MPIQPDDVELLFEVISKVAHHPDFLLRSSCLPNVDERQYAWFAEAILGEVLRRCDVLNTILDSLLVETQQLVHCNFPQK